MTACRNKASRAVTAALVGVLSVGAVPMVALAQTEAAPMASVQEETAFSEAEVELSWPTGSNPYNGGVQRPLVESVTPKGLEAPIDEDIESSENYLVYVVADVDGKPGDEKVTPIQAGTYYVVVEAVKDSPYAGSKVYKQFSISGKSFTGIQCFEGTDQNDHTFEYTAEPADVNFYVTDRPGTTHTLIEGVDYTVKYYVDGQDPRRDNGSETAPTDAKWAVGGKSYFAHLTGIGAYAGTTADVSFYIEPFNLSTSDVYVPVLVGKDAAVPEKPVTVNGSEALAAELKLVYQDDIKQDFGTFTAEVIPDTDDGKDPNFTIDSTGVKHIQVHRVETDVDFTYEGESIPETMTINRAKKAYIDRRSFAATYDGGTAVDAADWMVSYTNASGSVKKEATGANATQILNNLNNDPTIPFGTYTVTLTAIDATGHEYGGSVQFKVVITNGTLDCATSLYVSYDGTVISSFDRPFTGSPYHKFGVALYDGDEKLDEGEGKDYTWKIVDADGKQVDRNAPVFAGSYTLIVESDEYQLENATFDITVSKAEIQAIRLVNLVPVNGQYALAYNDGDPIDAVWQYTTGERNTDGDLIWDNYAGSALSRNSEIVVTTADGDAVKNIIEVGDYVATLKGVDTMFADNYELSAKPYKFSVAQELLFVDVTPDMYYYGSVLKAYLNNYIYGYNGGRVFGPTDSMSRADVAVVLYRMSGVENDDWDAEGSYVEGQGWNTGYVDCNNSAYYAEAVTWARKAGVVAGLDDTHFGPEQPVTREQFATMLANYAKARGQFKAADESVLDKYGDADQISAFARGTMAWAVEEGVMGGSANLMPTNEVTRADVAVMAINYQPVALWTPSN